MITLVLSTYRSGKSFVAWRDDKFQNLSRLPLSSRYHQAYGVALLPVCAEFSRHRGAGGQPWHHCFRRDHTTMDVEVRPGFCQ